jgi:hypothetical protein
MSDLKLGVVAPPIIPALRRLRQKDAEFKTSLGYMRDSVSKKIFFLIRRSNLPFKT